MNQDNFKPNTDDRITANASHENVYMALDFVWVSNLTSCL
jgi:hypothetical protein